MTYDDVVPTPLVSDTQREEFASRGFFFTGVLFGPRTVEGIRSACQRVWDASTDRLGSTPVTSTGDEIQRLRPYIPRLFEKSEDIRAFASHPVFCQLGRELIGPDVDLGWSQLCRKEPDPGDVTTFPYHQDGYFADVTHNDRGYACFMALAPLTVENGTLHFAAGAHRSKLAHRRNARHEWFECDVDGLELVPAVLAPGQMVVYRNMTPHGSPPNRTSAPREALLMSFGAPGSRLVETGELFGDRVPVLRGGSVVPES